MAIFPPHWLFLAIWRTQPPSANPSTASDGSATKTEGRTCRGGCEKVPPTPLFLSAGFDEIVKPNGCHSQPLLFHVRIPVFNGGLTTKKGNKKYIYKRVLGGTQRDEKSRIQWVEKNGVSSLLGENNIKSIRPGLKSLRSHLQAWY